MSIEKNMEGIWEAINESRDLITNAGFKSISHILFEYKDLKAENEWLTASRDGYAKGRDEVQRLFDIERSRAEAAETEVKRLHAIIKDNWYGEYWRAVDGKQAAQINAALNTFFEHVNKTPKNEQVAP